MRLRNGSLLRMSPLVLALGLVGLLTVLPHTGWIIRAQLRALAGQGIPVLSEWVSGEHRAVPTRGEGYDAELVAALAGGPTGPYSENEGPSSVAQAKRLHALTARYGDRPALHAHKLRFLSQGAIQVRREEKYLVTKPCPGESCSDSKRIDPELYRMFEESAARGEALDPGNAFFPAMRAAGYYATHRDDEAESALARAATRPTFNDYAMDEARARVTVAVARYGEIGGVARGAIYASILLPHFSVLRSTGQVAIGKAILLEREGKREEGLRLRRYVARLGATLRVESNTIIGSHVGIALTNTTLVREESILRQVALPPKDADERERQLQEWYIAYLHRIGHPEEAAWMTAELARGAETRALLRQAVDGTDLTFGPLINLIPAWGVGWFVLLATFWTLLGGGVVTLLARTRPIRDGLHLPRPVRWGMILGVALPTLIGLGLSLAESFFQKYPDGWVLLNFTYWPGVAVFTLASLAVVTRGETWRERIGHSLRLILALLGTLTPLALVTGSVLLTLRVAGIPTESLSWVSGSFLGTPARNDRFLGIALAVALLVPVPALTLLVCAIRSLVRKEAVIAGVVSGFRYAAPLLASVLLLGYAFLIWQTANQEATIRNNLETILQHEGRRYAEQTGQTWPGR